MDENIKEIVEKGFKNEEKGEEEGKETGKKLHKFSTMLILQFQFCFQTYLPLFSS